MAKRPAPPSSSDGQNSGSDRQSAGGAGTAPSRTMGVRDWLGGMRVSGFMVVMLTLVVLGAFVLVPTFSNYVQQRQQIAALERQVQATVDEVAELEALRERWNDPAYITTQARERLYYVQPGEVVYLVDNDLDAAHVPVEEQPISADVTPTHTSWATQLLTSVLWAGLAQTTSGVPAP